MLDLEDLTVDQLNSLKEGKQFDLEDLNVDQLNKLKQLQYQQQQKKDPFGFGGTGQSQLDFTNPFGKDDTIDLTSGVRNYDFRSNFAEQDNEAERVEYLKRKVGTEGFGKTADGTYYLNNIGLKKIGEDPLPEGKRGRAIDADLGFFGNLNPMNPDFLYDLAELKSSIGLPVLGAIAASVATGGMATIPAMAVVGLGGGVGKALDEFVFNGEDTQLSNPYQDIAYETALSAGGEGIGRALRGIFRYLLAPGQRTTAENLFTKFSDAKKDLVAQGYEPSLLSYRRFDPKLPIAQGLAQEAQDRGALPSILQATDRPILGRFQGMFDTIFGNPREYYNQRFMNNEMTKLILKSRGVDVAKEASSELAQLTKAGPRTTFGTPSKALDAYSAKLQQLAKKTFGEEQYNKLFKNEFINPEFLFKTYREGGENAFTVFKDTVEQASIGTRQAQKEIDRLLGDLLQEQLPKTSPKITSNEVLKNAQQAYVNYQKEGSVLYSRVDKAFGDKGIVDATPIKQMFFQEAAKKNIFMEDKAVQQVMRYLQERKPMLTYTQANTLRQYLDDIAFSDNPTTMGIPKAILARASNMLGGAIQGSPFARAKYVTELGKQKVISEWLKSNPRLLTESLDANVQKQILDVLRKGSVSFEDFASKRFTDLNRAQQNEIYSIVANNIDQYGDLFTNNKLYDQVLKEAVNDKKTLQEALRLKSIADDFVETNKNKFDKGLANNLIKQTTQRGAIDPAELTRITLRNKPDDLARVLKQIKFGTGKSFEKSINKMGQPLSKEELKVLTNPKRILKPEAERLGVTPAQELRRKALEPLEVEKTKLFLANNVMAELLRVSRNNATGGIQAKQFLDKVLQFAKPTGAKTPSTLELVMGKKETARLVGLAKELARNADTIDESVYNRIFTGKLANKDITNTGDLLKVFNDEVAKVKKYSEFETFLGDLTKPGMEGRQAINYLFSQNNIKKFTRVEQFLKETGQEQQLEQIRRSGVSKLLEEVIDSTSSVSDGVLLNGQKMLNKIVDLGGKDSLETFFGKELGKELFDFANQATFLGQKSSLSGGLVAASIALNPLRRAPLLIQLNVMSRLMGSRAFMNLLNRGIRAGNARDIAEISRIVGIQTQMLMKDVEDSNAFSVDNLSPFIQPQTTAPTTQPTQPAQPAPTPAPTAPQEVPQISMFAEQSIPDKIATLFPQDTLSQAIAKRSQG